MYPFDNLQRNSKKRQNCLPTAIQEGKGSMQSTLIRGDRVISARLVKERQKIMIFTRNGMAVRFEESLARTIGRVARGVKGVTLRDEKDHVVSCVVVNGDESILVVCEKGYGKRSKVDHFRQTNRGGLGVRSIITSKRNGYVVGAISVEDKDSVFLMSSSGQAIRINMKDVRVMGRSTQGVRLSHLRPEDLLVGIQKIEAIKEKEEK